MLKDEVVRNSIESAYAEVVTETGEEVRKTGIDAIGDTLWGTHFCQFYETKEDLIDVLVPYFKAGLENNEFCMWVTSEPLSEEEAKEAMRRAVADFDRYLKRGQIEIVPHIEWYLKDGVFNLQRVLNAWIDKLNQALAKGYDGIRVTGNTAWLKRDWKEFADYEEEVNNVIGKYRMIAICTYPLDKCGASEVLDVVRNHQFALIRRRGEWELIESLERKRVKEALRRSEAKFRNIFESANDCMALLDRSGRVLDANRKAVEVFGGSKEELLGKHFTRVGVVSFEDIPRVMSAFAKVLAGKQATINIHFKNKKDQEIHLECSASLMRIDDKFAGILLIARDITERKRAEEAIRESEETFRNLFESAGDGILTLDLRGRITGANKKIEELSGLSREEIIGKHITQFARMGVISLKDIPWILKAFTGRIRGQPTKVYELKIKNKKGEEKFIDFRGSLIQQRGKPIGILEIIRDVTERKRVEERLRFLKEFNEGIVNSIGETLLVIDPNDYKIITANEAALKQLKLRKEELIGKTCYEATHHRSTPCKPPHHICPIQEMLRTGRPVTLEHTHFDKGNNEIIVEVSAHPVTNQEGKIVHFVHLARDITERKKAEEKIRKSEEKYRNLFENARDLIVTTDLEGNITSANHMVEEYGYNQSGIIGKNWFNLAPKEFLQQFRDGFQKLAQGKQNEGEFKIFSRRKQDYATVEYRSNPIIQDNKVVGIQVIVRDITERKRAEEALRISEERARNLLEFQGKVIDTANVWIDLLDREGNVTLWNRAAELISGYSREEVIGHKKIWEWLYPDPKYRAEIFAGAKETMEKGKRAENYHTTVRCKDGTLKTISWYKNNIVDEKGNSVGSIAVGIDLTEIKETQEKVRESEERYRVLVESAADAIFTLNEAGNFLSANQEAAKAMGKTPEEMIGKNMYNLFPKNIADFQMRGVKVVFQTGNPILADETLTRTKFGQRWYSTSLMPVRDGYGKITYVMGIARDVTERRQVEDALRESEERLRQLIEYAPDAIYVNDLKGNFIDGNKQAENLTGYKRDELIGKSMLKVGLLPKRYVPKAAKALMKNLLGQKTGPDEFELIRKDGSQVTVEISTFPVKRGGKTEVIGIVRDITERKKMEEALRESEEKWRSLVKNAPNIIITVDQDGTILFINRTVPGFSVEETIGTSLYNYIDPKYHDIVKKTIKQVFQTGESSSFEIVGAGPDGTTSWYETQVGTIKYEGKTISVVLITTDITLRKQMQKKLEEYSEHLEELVQKRTEELSESEKRYSVLVEEASDGVVIIQDGKIIFANRKASEIAGFSRDEIIGVPFEKLVDERYREITKKRYIERMLGETVPSTYEIEIIAKTGEGVPIELSSTLIDYLGLPADLAIVRDIRERKRMEEQRLRLEKLATIGELATMVGHDLRNPLQSIENAAYYLNNELPHLSPSTPIPQRTMEMLQVINDSVNYADKIIRDLQDYSATKKPILEKTDINAIITETLSQVKAPENVKLITELSQLPETNADKDMIKRVFMNLATNGIQAMESRGTLKVSTKKTKDCVEVSFKDTGIGMSKENMEKIFTPFFTTKAKGMGMGLPICKRFVESHGGTIQVESEVGKGSTFTVKLPIQQPNGGEKT